MPNQIGTKKLKKLTLSDLPLHVWSKIVIDSNGCWLWRGYIRSDGYGRCSDWVEHKQKRVHRYVYELLIGPIPEGLSLDHLCKVRNCCYPNHLRPVTHKENSETQTYWQRAVESCPKGHPYAGENLIVNASGYRWCRTCKRDKQRAYMRKKLGITPDRYGVHTPKTKV